MIDDTDSEISIAQSDASIYEPLEKRLQKVYSEKRLNPLDQEVLLNKCPAIEIEKQLQKMINMEQSIKHKQIVNQDIANKIQCKKERMHKSNSKY